ncbi:MAG: hypothetical protein AVDCRST_MAG18-1289, partial [uncultured Thermomicrobiales bacterium]
WRSGRTRSMWCPRERESRAVSPSRCCWPFLSSRSCSSLERCRRRPRAAR